MHGAAGQNPDEITETELSQFIVLCRAQFQHLEDAFYQHEDGLLNEDAFATVLSGARGFARFPSGRVAWKEFVRFGYAGRFRDFTDGLVASAAHAVALVYPAQHEGRDCPGDPVESRERHHQAPIAARDSHVAARSLRIAS